MKINNKKGFTLVELLVVLALVAIVFACLIALVTLINQNIKINQQNNATINELENTKDFIEDWFYNYDEDIYSIFNVENSKITIKNINDQSFYLEVLMSGLITSGGATKDFNRISTVKFSKNLTTNIIKCTILYSEDQIFEFLLTQHN